VRTNHFK